MRQPKNVISIRDLRKSPERYLRKLNRCGHLFVKDGKKTVFVLQSINNFYGQLCTQLDLSVEKHVNLLNQIECKKLRNKLSNLSDLGR